MAQGRGTLAKNVKSEFIQEDIWITNETRFSTLVINMLIKAITHLFEWKSKPVNCWGDCEATETPNIADMTLPRPTGKKKVQLPDDPNTPLLGIYPRETKTYVRMKVCTQTFALTLS